MEEKKSKMDYRMLVTLFSTYTNSELRKVQKLINTEVRLSEIAISIGEEMRI